MAVDYMKTGVPARLSRTLRPYKWPHFMEKNRAKEDTYHSRKILGRLYDEVERVDFNPAFEMSFDNRILSAYKLDQSMLEQAYELKKEYDSAVRRIMAQHDIKSDFEVWSTFALHHSREVGDYKFYEEIGRLSASLKDRFRARCYEKVGSKDFNDIGPFVSAMYTVTAEEVTTAVEEQRQRMGKVDVATVPLMSFPWIFQNVLGKIANYPSKGEDSSGSGAVLELPNPPESSSDEQRATPPPSTSAYSTRASVSEGLSLD
ncbi:MAG: hypothetical protein Q9190_006367, partial [Brigantiaea leucoxantha]